ncbi:MAG: hypothetical protein ABJA57_12085 [Ginsengibacter sp.]
MKTTTIKQAKNSALNSVKGAFLAFQVIVIALAIPVLSYLQMSYDTKPDQVQSSKMTVQPELKQNATAFNQ